MVKSPSKSPREALKRVAQRAKNTEEPSAPAGATAPTGAGAEAAASAPASVPEGAAGTDQPVGMRPPEPDAPQSSVAEPGLAGGDAVPPATNTPQSDGTGGGNPAAPSTGPVEIALQQGTLLSAEAGIALVGRMAPDARQSIIRVAETAGAAALDFVDGGEGGEAVGLLGTALYWIDEVEAGAAKARSILKAVSRQIGGAHAAEELVPCWTVQLVRFGGREWPIGSELKLPRTIYDKLKASGDVVDTDPNAPTEEGAAG
jgi:hypothetical protein